MFSTIKVGKEKFVIIPEREYRRWIKEGFSPETTGARALTKTETEQIVSEMKSDKSKGISSQKLKEISKKW